MFVYGGNLWYDSRHASTSKIHLTFLVVHLSLLFTSASINFTIPRRPKIFHHGNPEKPVDNERTVSVLSRYTLSWANPLLSHAIRKGGLDFNDLPYLDVRATTDALVSRFNCFKATRLWKHTLRAHRSTFFYQWILTLIYSLATLAPQYFMWRLIRILEVNATHPDQMAISWLALLGFAQLVQPWIETWMLWVGWCHIALPISVQLSGLIIGKSLRRKDVKDIKTKTSSTSDYQFERLDTPKNKRVESESESAEKEILAPKGMQDQINLITVDTKRLSDFLSYNSMSVIYGDKTLCTMLMDSASG